MEKDNITLKASSRYLDQILQKAYGNNDKAYAQDGMRIEGPSHEEGGVDVNVGGEAEPSVEAEGGERIFSVEDTQLIEQASAQIAKMMGSGNQQEAQQMAAQLGFAIVDMIMKQEQSQAGQEGQMAGGAGGQGAGFDETAAMNSF